MVRWIKGRYLDWPPPQSKASTRRKYQPFGCGISEQRLEADLARGLGLSPAVHGRDAVEMAGGWDAGSGLSPEHNVDSGKHHVQLPAWQLTDAFGELAPVDGDDQRDVGH
jgi:hypothetical protein